MDLYPQRQPMPLSQAFLDDAIKNSKPLVPLPIPQRSTITPTTAPSSPSPAPRYEMASPGEIADTLGAVGEAVVRRTPLQIAGAAASAIRGGSREAVADKDSFLTKIIDYANKDADDLQKKYADNKVVIAPLSKIGLTDIDTQTVARFPQQAAFSAVSAGAGLAAGLGAAAVSGPAAPVTGRAAGMAASGGIAYRMQKDMSTQQLYEKLNETSLKNTGRALTPDEWKTAYSKNEGSLAEQGIAEAIPEAIGNLAGFELFFGAAKNVFGKQLAKTAIGKTLNKYGAAAAGKLLAEQATEQTTETWTQQWQNNIDVEMGLKPGETKRSWLSFDDLRKSNQEVFSDILLLSTVMGGAALAGEHVKEKRDAKASAQLVKDVVAENKFDSIPNEFLPAIYEHAQELSDKRPKDKALTAARDAFATEMDKRGIDFDMTSKFKEYLNLDATVKAGEAQGDDVARWVNLRDEFKEKNISPDLYLDYLQYQADIVKARNLSGAKTEPERKEFNRLVDAIASRGTVFGFPEETLEESGVEKGGVVRKPLEPVKSEAREILLQDEPTAKRENLTAKDLLTKNDIDIQSEEDLTPENLAAIDKKLETATATPEARTPLTVAGEAPKKTLDITETVKDQDKDSFAQWDKQETGAPAFIRNKVEKLFAEGGKSAVLDEYRNEDSVSAYARYRLGLLEKDASTGDQNVASPDITGVSDAIPVSGEVTTKEPWEYTRNEWASGTERVPFEKGSRGYKIAAKGHEEFVKRALSEGKTVPPEVLKDYPDLAATHLATSKAITPDENGEINGYGPGHPWYYKLGGKPLQVDSIKTSKSIIESTLSEYRGKKPDKISEAIAATQSALEKDIARYNDIIGKGDDAISDYDKKMGWGTETALSLKHNHISADKSRIEALNQLLSPGKTTPPADKIAAETKEAPPKKDARQAAIDRYKTHIAKHTSNPDDATNNLVKLIDAKDNVGLRRWMNGINPEVNRLFTAITGLPAKTQKEADASLRSLNPEGWDKWQEEKKNKAETEAAERESKRNQTALDAILNEQVNYNGKEIISRRDLYQRLVDEGYTEIQEKKRGALPEYWLTNPTTRNMIKIPKKLAVDHVRKLIKAKKEIATKADKKTWTSTEIEALEKDYFAQQLKGKSPAEEVPNVVLTGGLTAVGKSNLVDTHIPKDSPHVRINADDVKGLAGMEEAGKDDAFHEISSNIANHLLDKCLNEGYDIIYDSQLTNFKKAKGIIERTTERGGRVSIYYLSAHAETSKARNIARNKKGESKRLPPDEALVKGHNYALPTFLALYQEYRNNDKVSFTARDNDVDFRPAIEIFKKTQEGVTIYDRGLFDKLMATEYIGVEGGNKYVRKEQYTEAELAEKEDVIQGRVQSLIAGRKEGGGRKILGQNEGNDSATGRGSKSPARTPQVTPPTDLSAKSTQELVGDIFKIINDHIGTRGSFSAKEKTVDEGLYQKLKPYLTEIANRAKAKALDVKAYLFGAVDSMPDGQAKTIYEAAADRYVNEALDMTNKKDKLQSQEGGKTNERQADGGHGQRSLEGNESGSVSGDRGGRSPDRGKRSGGETDDERNESSDETGDVGDGGVAGEPSSIHLQDSGANEEELPAESGAETAPVSEPRTRKLSGDNPGNYRITETDDIGSGTRGEKIDRNLAAIRLVKQLDQERRYPTKEEQSILAKYVGWGGIKNVFDKSSTKPQDIKARKELESLLTKDEYLEAFLSITNAFYTSPKVIESIYKVLRHFGFTGGNILEPTYGAGNFIGLMPADMAAASKWYGSELDKVTAKIGQYLYPDSQLIESGFQNAEFPFGKFDLAIGNPPFGDERLTDTNKARSAINRFKIHNYIISKSGMHLRPGGIMGMVVTNRFLDTANPEARDFLAKQFRFLGAIRLPNDAFAKNAGTEVTTDIVFLQRLMPDENPEMDADWLSTGATMENSQGEIITLNKYFADRPYLMLGEPSMKGTMYGGHWKQEEGGKGEFTLNKREDQADTATLIDKVIATHFADLKGVMRQRANDKADAEALSWVPNKEDVGIGGFYEANDKIYMRGDNDEYGSPTFAILKPTTKWTEKTALGQKRYDRIKGMLKLRQMAYDLVKSERFDLDGIEHLRAKLNAAYDAFVKEHGYLSEPANFSLMADDVRIEFGLESGFRKEITKARAKALGIEPSPAYAEKASILTERVFYPEKEILFAKDAHDGYNISLSQKGKLDLDYIAGLTGQSRDEVIKDLSEEALIYQDPDTQQWIQEDEYLSGNVKAKYEKVKDKEEFKKNAEALKKVFPRDLTADEIKAIPGAPWIPEGVYQAFGQFLGMDGVTAHVYRETGAFRMEAIRQNPNEISVALVNNDYSIADIFNAAANNRTLIAYDGYGDDRKVNKERTTALVSIVKSMREIFDNWVYADGERTKLLCKTYNETQNTHAKRKFTGEHMHTVGASPAIELRYTQRDAAWRMIQSPVVLLDHCVGAGKTFTMITGVMERVRMGLTKKAMIAVPNHLVGQWAADFLKLYPGANILAATKKDFQKSNRRRLFARIATGNFDAIIVGHSSFGFIPVERETITQLVQEELELLERALRAAEAAKDKRMIRTLVKKIQKKRERIAELLNRERDNVTAFESMGVDHLIVDESHEFKNLEYSSSMQNITGMGTPMGSKRAFDLYSKIRWLTGQKDHAITFATGTPISNSLVEMYAILRYLNRDALVRRGIDAFDSWAKSYASIEARVEYTASQRLKERVVMAKFGNLPELLQLYNDFADTITMDDLKRIYAEQMREKNKRLGTHESESFPIPGIVDGGRRLDAADPSPEQVEFVDYLVARSMRLEDLGGENDPRVDNALWIMSDARKMALDIRLVDPAAPAYAKNKISRATKRIKAIYDRTTNVRGAQLVFCDLSTPAGTARKNAQAVIKEALRKAALDKDPATLGILQGLGSFQAQWGYIRNRIEAEIEAIVSSQYAETEQYMARCEALTTYLESMTDEVTSDLTTADTGFSVYDEMKSTLIDMGIPEGEIKFIHDAASESQKQELFDLVNTGKVRVLLGSSMKMGAGMNVQERLVALHHMDAPWRPSDVEQREGRIVRQGNKLYDVNPNFEVEIHAYSTKNTFDAVSWQILARKASMLEDFRSGKREVEDTSSDASSYSDFMAETTGNPVFKEKFQLESAIKEMQATATRISVQRRSAEQALLYYHDKRPKLEATILRREEQIQKIDHINKFTYRGVDYTANARDIVDKEKERLNEINRSADKEYNDAILPEIEAAWEKAGPDLTDEDKYKISLKVTKDSKVKKPRNILFHADKLAKLDKSGTIAIGLQMIDKINAMPVDDTFTFNYGGIEIGVQKLHSGYSSETQEVYYFKVTADGDFLYDILSHRVDFREDDIWPLLSIDHIKQHMDWRLQENRNDLQQMDRYEKQSKLTLERLQFKDQAKLEGMLARYQEVLTEVRQAELDIARRRIGTTNHHIERDRMRFGDYDPWANLRRKMEAADAAANAEPSLKEVSDKVFGELRAEADQAWDKHLLYEYILGEADPDYIDRMIKGARAEAILSLHGRGDIGKAQEMIRDAAKTWDIRYAEEDDRDMELDRRVKETQRIIGGIVKQQGQLFEDSLYSIKSAADFHQVDIPLNVQEIEALLPESSKRMISQEKDGSISIVTKLGQVRITGASYIPVDRGSYKEGYRIEYSGETATGSYSKKAQTITLLTDNFGNVSIKDFGHELTHFLVHMGVITQNELTILKAGLRKESPYINDHRTIEEIAADFVGKQIRDRAYERRSMKGRVLQKIADFFDALVNMLARTSRGIVRDIESGRMFERNLDKKAEGGRSTHYSASDLATGIHSSAFKKWFGDWEAVFSAKPERAAATFAKAKEHAAAFVGKEIENISTGVTATVSNTNLEKMTSASSSMKSTTAEDHALAIANMDKLFRNALLIERHPDKKNEPTISEILRFVAPMIARRGNVVAVKMTVKKTTSPKQPNPIYTINTVEIAKPALDVPQGGIEWAPDERNTPQASFNSHILSFLNSVKPESVSKVVDQKGKPMVVYHTGLFNDSQILSGSEVQKRKGREEDSDRFNHGIYFTADPAYSSEYGKDFISGKQKDGASMYPVYLSIKNPLIIKNDEDLSKMGGGGYKDMASLFLSRESLNELKRKGYDGIINEVWDEIVAFDPTQIKSATANVGTYGADNPDIRYSVQTDTIDSASLFPKVDERLKAAKGVKYASLKDRAKDALVTGWEHFTRHFQHLEPETDGAVIDVFRKFQDVPAWAKDETVRQLSGIVGKLSPQGRDVFTMNIILPDMLRDIENGTLSDDDEGGLPFGYKNRDQVQQDYDHYQAISEENPDIAEALDKRNRFMANLTAQLILHKLLKEESAKDPSAYFHHQVLAYMNYKENPNWGMSSRDVRTHRKGWQLGRKGSQLDYNTEYVESEFEIISQALTQIETVKSLKEIERLADIKPQLEAKAKTQNMKVFWQRAYTNPLDDPLKPFRQKIAMGFGRISALVSQGDLYVPSEFDDVLDFINDQAEQRKAAKKDEQDFNPSMHPRMFALLNYLINHEGPGSMSAAMVFKAIAERNNFIRDVVGRDWVTYQDFMPDGYVIHKPEAGSTFYFADTIADRALGQVLAGQRALMNSDVKQVLARGRDAEWVVKEGISKTLNEFRPAVTDSLPAQISKDMLTTWKQWILMNPFRVIKYNLNNMSGDLDICMAYDPAIIKDYFWKATKDLWAASRGKAANDLLDELSALTKRGVIGSGMTAMDIPELANVKAVKDLVDFFDGKSKNALSRWYSMNKKMSTLRENILRLAADRYFTDRLNNGDIVYGASRKEEVDAIENINDKAAKLARELIGDYGNISHAGQYIRERLIPFYSWMEINAPRYVRLFRNLKNEGAGMGAFGGVLAWKTTKLALKAAALMGLVMLWNAAMFPDEEDELQETGREQLHLILGRRADGSIITLRFQGALSDALSWFGMNNPLEQVKKIASGRKGAGDIAKDVATAAPVKLFQGMRPEPKLLYEVASGQTFFPDPLHPRPIRDLTEHILRTFSLDKIYDRVAGKPKQGGNWENQFVRDIMSLALNEADPGEQAYYTTRKYIFDWLEKQGKERPVAMPTNKSNALYYYKQALKFGDFDAAAKYLKKYQDMGGKMHDVQGSIRRVHPLASLRLSDRYKFRQSLSPEQQETLSIATAWYKKHYIEARNDEVAQRIKAGENQ